MVWEKFQLSMGTYSSCDSCGRYRGPKTKPHPNHESCPFKADHEGLNSDDTLREAIQKTCAQNSVSLMGWSSSYPLFRTVIKTRTWLVTEDTPTENDNRAESYNTSYFKKTILATNDLSDLDSYYRIEYDPTTESLITWYTVTDDQETEATGSFRKFIRSDNSDVSYFGATLPD